MNENNGGLGKQNHIRVQQMLFYYEANWTVTYC